VEAVAREFLGRNVVPEVAGLCALDQQAPDEAGEVLLRSGDVLTSMQERRQLGAVVLVVNERVGLEHSFEPRVGFASLVSEAGELSEMAGDLAFVPGDQDRFDVWKVL